MGVVGGGALLMQHQQGNQMLPLVLSAPPARLHKATVPSGSIVLIKRHISRSSILYTLYLWDTNVSSHTTGAVDIYSKNTVSSERACDPVAKRWK